MLPSTQAFINTSCTNAGCFGPELAYDSFEAVQQENGDIVITWSLLNGFSGELRAISDELYAVEAENGLMAIGSGLAYLARPC